MRVKFGVSLTLFNTDKPMPPHGFLRPVHLVDYWRVLDLPFIPIVGMRFFFSRDRLCTNKCSVDDPLDLVVDSVSWHESERGEPDQIYVRMETVDQGVREGWETADLILADEYMAAQGFHKNEEWQ